MNIEIAKKLLKSPNREDVLIGLTIIRDWTWKDLLLIRDSSWDGDTEFLIHNDLAGHVDNDCYLLKNAYCHWNTNLFFYEGSPNRKQGYITL